MRKRRRSKMKMWKEGKKRKNSRNKGELEKDEEGRGERRKL